VVAVTLVALGSLPALARYLPSPGVTAENAAALIARIRASGPVGFSGYAESHGTLAIPDATQLGNLPSLLGDTTRMRAWWTSASQWRVDVIDPLGETDTYGFPSGTWVWDSQRRRATAVDGEPPVRVPRAADLLPSTLGRRLAGAAGSAQLSRLPTHVIAGRDAQGVRLVPGHLSTVDHVDVWADNRTGVPLQVQITARGESHPTISSAFLDISFGVPAATTTTFSPPLDAFVQQVSAADLQGLLGRLFRVPYPRQLAGLPATEAFPGQAGVATYGDALGLLAVATLSNDDADHFAAALKGRATPVHLPGMPQARALSISTPLITALLVSTRNSDILLAGTLPAATVQSAYLDLVAQFRVGQA
jgi:hypothetical protein